jgi:hypothetical protein
MKDAVPFLPYFTATYNPDVDKSAVAFSMITGSRLYSDDRSTGIQIQRSQYLDKKGLIESKFKKITYDLQDGKISQEDFLNKTSELTKRYIELTQEFDKFQKDVMKQEGKTPTVNKKVELQKPTTKVFNFKKGK